MMLIEIAHYVVSLKSEGTFGFVHGSFLDQHISVVESVKDCNVCNPDPNCPGRPSDLLISDEEINNDVNFVYDFALRFSGEEGMKAWEEHTRFFFRDESDEEARRAISNSASRMVFAAGFIAGSHQR